MKNIIITNLKLNIQHIINSNLDIAQERFSELEDRAEDQKGAQRNKRMRTIKEKLRDM